MILLEKEIEVIKDANDTSNEDGRTSIIPLCKPACDILFNTLGVIAKDVAQCTEDAALVFGACQVAGGGPENPLADVCSLGMGLGFMAACVLVVNAKEEFGAEKCKQKICGSDEAELKKMRMTYEKLTQGNEIRALLKKYLESFLIFTLKVLNLTQHD